MHYDVLREEPSDEATHDFVLRQGHWLLLTEFCRKTVRRKTKPEREPSRFCECQVSQAFLTPIWCGRMAMS